MPMLQDIIHKLEVGPWFRHIKLALACLAVFMLVVGYNWRAYRNINTQDGMDAVQVARNISEGRGFTTQFIRPFSVYLVKEANKPSSGSKTSDLEGPTASEQARLTGMHPDLANAPLYPFMMAGWIKGYTLALGAADGVRSVMPKFIKGRIPPFNDDLDNRLWTSSDRFWWHPHDFLIAMFNQALVFVTAWLTFLIARRLFDAGVAWMSALLVLCCELLWRFSTSGLSTMLMLVIFMALVRCLLLLEQEFREPSGNSKRFWLPVAGVGLLLGLGVLTRYAFGWLLIPVLAFVFFLAGPRKFAACGVIAGLFLLLLAPWVIRNFSVSGTPFGFASYAIVDGAPAYPHHRLARSSEPQLGANFIAAVTTKFIGNIRGVLTEDLPRLAGGWVTPVFLTGLMLGFRNPATRKLRYFVLMCLGLLIVVQTLARTSLWTDSPEINSENLLVLLVPLLMIFGVGLFFILLDQMALRTPNARYGVMGLFAAVVCLPMIFAFAPPRTIAVTYPPYFPPLIKESAEWMSEKEMMMSDIPWAVAWYGDRQCIWLSRDANESFYAINDYLKSVRAIYLTQSTVDQKLQSQVLAGGKEGWGAFLLDSTLNRQVLATFPLRQTAPMMPAGQLFLTDRERWETDPAPPPAKRASPDEPKVSEKSTNQPGQQP